MYIRKNLENTRLSHLESELAALEATPMKDRTVAIARRIENLRGAIDQIRNPERCW